MSSFKRNSNQCPKEGVGARRHALPGGPTSKSVRNIYGSTGPGSPLRHRTKYELRSISFEGTKVLPWTIRWEYLYVQKIILIINKKNLQEKNILFKSNLQEKKIKLNSLYF